MADFDVTMLTDMAVAWGLKIVAALLVFLVGKWVASRIARLVVTIMEKQQIDVTLTRFLKNYLIFIHQDDRYYGAIIIPAILLMLGFMMKLNY